MIRSQGRPALFVKLSIFAAAICLFYAPRPAAAVESLSFHITTRAAYHDPADNGSVPEQTMEAHVLLRGERMRIESTIGGRAVVMLYAPPYLFRIYPESQTGVRYNGDSLKLPGFSGDLDIGALVANPSGFRSALVGQGAKQVKSAQLDGVTVDVYKASKFMGRPQQVTAWFRHSDALPLRLVLESRRLTVVSSWSGYGRKELAPSLFAVPPGYRIRPADSE